MNTLSKTENKVLMTQAREALRGKWGVAIGGVVVYAILVFGFSFIPTGGEIVSYLLEGVLALGLAGFGLSLSRKQDVKVLDIFNEKFWVSLGAWLLQLLFIVLWALLLIIPGIIALYSYALTYYILVDNKEMGIQEAIQKSKEMMQGNKWKLACLEGRFIGWGLLCILSLGIGFLWLCPYMMISYAQFYDDIKEQNESAIGAAV
jgi:uncharacterized membrane protein